MGGVDRTGQMRKTYGYDRKSKRYWLRLFFHLFDLVIGNSYILYKHECNRVGARPVASKDFRVELIHSLLSLSRRKYCSGYGSRSLDTHLCVGVCQLINAGDVQLKRGRCHLCVRVRENERHDQIYTVYACSVCKVRLCKVDCFARFHQ